MKYEKLLKIIGNLKKSKVKSLVDTRIREFKKTGKESNNKIFKELCFCILTANFDAEKSIKIQKNIDNGFLNFTTQELSEKLKKLGHRFPNARAKYIVEAREYKNSLRDVIRSFDDENKSREWLVESIKGIGYKEASHFLRNTGYKNLAIVDFHIVDVLVKHKLIKRPKTLTKKKYLKIENLLKKVAERSNLNLAELDLYLWFYETGKLLK